MAYIHNVDPQCEIGPSLRHFRETVHPSGIISVNEIARTFVSEVRQVESTDIILPSALDTLQFGSEPLPSDIATNSTEAKDLSDFVASGVKAWCSLCGKLGIDGGKARLAEAMTGSIEDERIRDSGLIELILDAKPEFTGFEATPDEIEHLQKLERAINDKDSLTSADRSGVYL